MCLIVLSLNEHPEYRLIVTANRDEYYNRATAVANYWEGHPEVLGGRDLQAGGTWLGMNVNGRISMVTNYRDYSRIDPIAPSRGQLVSDYLLSDDRPLRYMEKIAAEGARYNGFNLIAGNARELYYYSNYGNGVIAVPPGLHGLSNHLLNTPWPKVKNAVAKVKPIMTANRVNIDDLMDAMYDDTLAADADLPDTGIGVARERLLSPIFIKSPGYGSRNTTVVLVDRSDKVQFVERSYNITDFSYTTQAFSFRIR